jgi:dolichyl-phosphate-mannose--protein O-mannosyl transferase
MLATISQSRRFLTEWVIFNVVGFVLGFWLGATDDNVITRLFGQRFLMLAISDMFNAGTFGLAQYFVLRRHFPESRQHLLWWVATSAIGFMIGARLAVRFAGFFTFQVVPFSIVFGTIIGAALGLVQWAAMRYFGKLQAAQPAVWIPVCIIAWALSEQLYTMGGGGLRIMPLFGLFMGLLTGVALVLWVRPR